MREFYCVLGTLFYYFSSIVYRLDVAFKSYLVNLNILPLSYKYNNIH